MAVKEILLIGNPDLRKKSDEVKDFNDQLDVAILDLKDTLMDFQERKRIGRAIAAPQIGIFKKIIYIHTPRRSFELVNPRIVDRSEEMFDVWDSCFSFDARFFVYIKRHKSIHVEYSDKSGLQISEMFDDDMAELLQHEIDHLHGILATDHLTDNKNIILRAEWEKRYK